MTGNQLSSATGLTVNQLGQVVLTGGEVIPSDGDINLIGTGGNGGIFNDGIDIQGGSQLSSQGNITLRGQAGNGAGQSDGIYLLNSTLQTT